MLDLGESDKVQELDEKLVHEVSLIVGESFDGDENGRGSNDKGVQGVDGRGRKEGKPNWLGGEWGCVGRFVSARG